MSEETLITTFVRLRKGFLRLATRLLSKEDAEDALQEAFYRLWPRRDLINTLQEAEAMTVTTIRNLCIDQLRKQKTEWVELDEERDARPDDGEEEVLIRERLLDEVERLIDRKLSPMQQLILRKKEYEGQRIEDIARQLGMQQAAVRMQLSRARKIIRECYLKEKEDERNG